jgi:ribose 5-phosphate isomerase B
MSAAEKKTIYLAADHGGLELKKSLLKHLQNNSALEVVDLGTNSEESVDYPDFGHLLAEKITANSEALGIAICGTGIGISMSLNRHDGVRAALVATEFMAKMAKAHNNANVLALGGRVVDAEQAIQFVDIWLNEKFEGDRHLRRIRKIDPEK